MKATRGPAAAGPLRWALAAIAAVVLAVGLAGCLGGDDSPDRPPGALAAGLAYLPATSGVAIAVPTRFQAGQSNPALLALVRRLVAASGVRLEMVPPAQLGNPLALGLVSSGRLVGATQVRDGDAMRRQVQARIERGRAASAGERDGALLWKQGSAYGAVQGDDVVLGHSRNDIEQALDAGSGSDSMAFDDAVLAMLARLATTPRRGSRATRSGCSAATPIGRSWSVACLGCARSATSTAWCSLQRGAPGSSSPCTATGRRCRTMTCRWSRARVAPACTTRTRARPLLCWRRTAWPVSSNRCWG